MVDDEARFIEQWGRPTGFEIPQDVNLSEGHDADLERQITFDDHTLVLCHTETLSA